jgi:hypothetical protein
VEASAAERDDPANLRSSIATFNGSTFGWHSSRPQSRFCARILKADDTELRIVGIVRICPRYVTGGVPAFIETGVCAHNGHGRTGATVRQNVRKQNHMKHDFPL